MTKLSNAALISEANTLFTENTAQEISGADANTFCIDLLDSLSVKQYPVAYHELNIMLEDLDANKQVVIPHLLNSTELDIVLYNHNGIRIYTPYFDFQIINTSS